MGLSQMEAQPVARAQPTNLFVMKQLRLALLVLRTPTAPVQLRRVTLQPTHVSSAKLQQIVLRQNRFATPMLKHAERAKG